MPTQTQALLVEGQHEPAFPGIEEEAHGATEPLVFLVLPGEVETRQLAEQRKVDEGGKHAAADAVGQAHGDGALRRLVEAGRLPEQVVEGRVVEEKVGVRRHRSAPGRGGGLRAIPAAACGGRPVVIWSPGAARELSLGLPPWLS